MRFDLPRYAMVLPLACVLVSTPALADIAWRKLENGRQSVFIAEGNPWGFAEPDWLSISVNDKGAGRSEWLRWGSAASISPTARFNHQRAINFRYYSVKDEFDAEVGSHGGIRRGDVRIIETDKGRVEALDFEINWKGYFRNCLYFKFADRPRREISKGYLCADGDRVTSDGELRMFIDALVLRDP